MEHIVQFGISIDDDYIKRCVEENAVNKVISEVRKEYKQELKREIVDGYGRLNEQAVAIMREFLKDNQDEILKMASESVAKSIKSSKKYKEAIINLVSQIEDGEQ